MTHPQGGARLQAVWHEYRGVLLFMILMLGFRSAWADWVVVPTGSMNPTIIEGDRVLVDKHAYGLRLPLTHIRLTRGADPARGEIVVFDSPVDGTSLVKRVVAVPGDVVELDGERLIVNGQTAQYSLGDRDRLRDLLRSTAAQNPMVLRETGLGRAHDMLLLPGRPAPRSFGPIRVPAQRYFMLGDNRDNSADSRYIGLVPRSNIVGRALRVVASFNPEDYYLPRTDRFLIPLG